MTDELSHILAHAANWPEAAQRELAEAAEEIEAELKGGCYHLGDDELASVRNAAARTG